MAPKKIPEFEECLREASELEQGLESTLDRSLTEPHIDPNQYIRQYNRLVRLIVHLQADEVVEDIFNEISLYEFTGDDRTDIATTKQRLVEVYLRVTQLVAYLETTLELG